MQKLKTIRWAFKIAWDIDHWTMLLWFAVCGALAVLPAVALQFNKQTLSVISGFLSGGAYTYADVVKPIVGLGLLMIAIGLSARVNSQFVRMMTYDSYFGGMYAYIMERVQDIEMKDLLRKDVNDMWMSAILEGNSLWAFVEGLCFIFAKIVGIAALLVTAFSMSKLIFAISAVYVIVIFIISLAFAKKTRYNQTEDFNDERMIEYYEKMSDNHGMAKETRIFENTDEVIEQWRKPYERIQKRDLRRQKSAELRDFIVGAGFYAFLIATVGVSVYSVARGTMTPDVFLVLFTLCLNIYSTISGTARYIVRFDFGLIALDKQRGFFELIKPETGGAAETPADDNTVFEVKNLKFSYDDKPTINDISFKVNKGEVIALVGQNGSGKSTLVKLLLNIYKPDSGTIKVLGREYSDYKRDYIRGKIGVFFQDFYIFHSPLRENVGVGAVEDIENITKILEAIKKGGAEKVVSNLPKGLDTLLGTFQDPSGTELSGGEKQRVASSRAHMSDRDVLIFDEPASMLDPIAEMEQFNNIKGMLGGRTAILISHRVGFARMADKIIMLENGEIAESGKHDELMRKNGLYAHFFNEQAQWYSTTKSGGDAE
ncbi:MAG: ABC transporter ATP-binding protein/permease [Oscillospiraceae bacterium]|jgi:ATP-binding cassette subfamily B protein|nr:ABC transporter ATP-binding protein/permease [Oscillospiraceae bacterium]